MPSSESIELQDIPKAVSTHEIQGNAIDVSNSNSNTYADMEELIFIRNQMLGINNM